MRILVGILAISLCSVASYSQDQAKATVGEKHFGSVCTKLTGDSECKVCGLDNSHHWRCYSHTLWKEIPGTAMPLPDASPSAKRRTKSGDSDACSGESCNANSCSDWSPKFDDIQDDEVLKALRQQQSSGWTSTTANDSAALQSALEKVEDSIPQVEETISALGGGDYHSVDSAGCKRGQYTSALGAALCERLNRQNMVSALEGTLEIASCRTGGGGGGKGQSGSSNGKENASEDVVPNEPIPAKPEPPKKSDCQALVVYRDTQLQKDFDLAISQYNIFNEGMLNQEDYAKKTLNLMNKEWWAGETAAGVAIEVKYLTDMINNVLGMFVPGESKALKFVQHTAITVDVLKTEVEDGAKKASEEGGKAVTKELAEEIAGPILGMDLDTLEYQERKDGMAAYKAEVQQRVRAIEQTVNSFHTKMKQSKARAQAITEIMAQIDQACSSNSNNVNLTPR